MRLMLRRRLKIGPDNEYLLAIHPMTRFGCYNDTELFERSRPRAWTLVGNEMVEMVDN